MKYKTLGTINNISIIRGEYVIFNPDNTVGDYPDLIGHAKTIDFDAYQIFGCKFPISENNEKGHTESINSFKTLINSISNPIFANRASSNSTPSTTLNVNKSKTTYYHYVFGHVFNGNERITNDIVDYYLPVKSTNEKQYYFIHGEKIYTIELKDPDYNDEDMGSSYRKFDIIEEISISNSLKSIIKGNAAALTNESIAYNTTYSREKTNESGFENVQNNTKYDTGIGRNIKVEINYTVNYNIWSGVLKDDPGENSNKRDWITKDDENGNPIALDENLITPQIIEQGISNYDSNNEFINDTKYTAFYLSALSEHRASAIENRKGIWKHDYWRNKVSNNTWPCRTSYSSIKSHLICPYKYAHNYINNPEYKNRDKSIQNLGDRVYGATMLGDIIHSQGEKIIKQRIEKGSKLSDSELSYYIKKALSQWATGAALGGEDYSFTQQDIQSINNEAKQSGIKTIDTALKNVNSRDYVNEYTISKAETSIEGAKYEVFDYTLNVIKKRFNVVGYIDTVLYNPNNNRLVISDLKSNRIYTGTGNRITDKYESLSNPDSVYTDKLSDDIIEIVGKESDHTTTEYESILDTFNKNHANIKQKIRSHYANINRAQIVWYLYFAIQKGELGIDTSKITTPLRKNDDSIAENEAEILIIMRGSNLQTFFDMVRYDGSKYKEEISPNERIALWFFLIRPSLRNLASRINQLDKNDISKYQFVGEAKTNKSDKNCEYCDHVSYCPAYKENRADNTTFRNLTKLVSAPSVPIVSPRTDVEYSDLSDRITEYMKLATGVSTDVKYNNNKRSRENYIERKHLLKDIDEKYVTQIGATYISSTITQISAIDTKRHGYNDTLRTLYPAVHRTQGSERQVVVTIRFDNKERINSELRHIIAQSLCTSFISIRNPEITRIMIPFDTNKEIYWANEDQKVHKLVKRYLTMKSTDKKLDFTTLTATDDESSLKNQIYKRMRLYYSIQDMKLSAVPNKVDTVDLTLRLQLTDTLSTSNRGSMDYLVDTHSTLLQQSWVYNKTSPKVGGGKAHNLAQSVLNVVLQQKKAIGTKNKNIQMKNLFIRTNANTNKIDADEYGNVTLNFTDKELSDHASSDAGDNNLINILEKMHKRLGTNESIIGPLSEDNKYANKAIEDRIYMIKTKYEKENTTPLITIYASFKHDHLESTIDAGKSGGRWGAALGLVSYGPIGLVAGHFIGKNWDVKEYSEYSTEVPILQTYLDTDNNNKIPYGIIEYSPGIATTAKIKMNETENQIDLGKSKFGKGKLLSISPLYPQWYYGPRNYNSMLFSNVLQYPNINKANEELDSLQYTPIGNKRFKTYKNFHNSDDIKTPEHQVKRVAHDELRFERGSDRFVKKDNKLIIHKTLMLKSTSTRSYVTPRNRIEKFTHAYISGDKTFYESLYQYVFQRDSILYQGMVMVFEYWNGHIPHFLSIPIVHYCDEYDTNNEESDIEVGDDKYFFTDIRKLYSSLNSIRITYNNWLVEPDTGAYNIFGTPSEENYKNYRNKVNDYILKWFLKHEILKEVK